MADVWDADTARVWDADTARKSLLDHELPPPGFTFAGASSSDRLRYGFPAEPDRKAQPHLWAKWERNLDRPWRRVLPEYELQPARPLPSPLPQGGGTSTNWSGQSRHRLPVRGSPLSRARG
jgi:hypothetical protein